MSNVNNGGRKSHPDSGREGCINQCLKVIGLVTAIITLIAAILGLLSIKFPGVRIRVNNVVEPIIRVVEQIIEPDNSILETQTALTQTSIAATDTATNTPTYTSTVTETIEIPPTSNLTLTAISVTQTALAETLTAMAITETPTNIPITPPTPTSTDTPTTPLILVEGFQTINVRSQPNTQSTVVTTLSPGDIAPIIGQTVCNNFIWWQITISDNNDNEKEREGWVRDDVVSTQGNTDKVPTVAGTCAITPSFPITISAQPLGIGMPCDADIHVTVHGNDPIQVRFHVWNAFFGSEGDVLVPHILPPGNSVYTVTFGGNTEQYREHAVWVADMSGKVISNRVNSRCN